MLRFVDPNPSVILLPAGIKEPRCEPRPDGHGYRMREQVDGHRRQWNGQTAAATRLAWLRDRHPELLPARGASRNGWRPASVDELFAAYLPWLEGEVAAGRKSPTTLRSSRGVAARLILPCPLPDPDHPGRTRRLGSVGFDELEAEGVDQMTTWIQTAAPNRQTGGAGLSASQAAQARMTLSAAYTYARIKRKVKVESPVHDSENVRVEGHQALDIPTPEQVRQFLAKAEADGDHLLAFWRLAFTTGARDAEVAGAKLSSLIGRDDEELPSRIRYWSQVQLVEGIWYELPPKRHSKRTLGLSDATARALVDAASATLERSRVHPEWDPRWSDYVFRRRDGTPYPASEISTLFSERLVKAGLPHWNFHLATRHFACSVWIAAGASVFQVYRRLGHKDGDQVQHTYAHLWDEFDPLAAPQMERVLAEWLPAGGVQDPE